MLVCPIIEERKCDKITSMLKFYIISYNKSYKFYIYIFIYNILTLYLLTTLLIWLYVIAKFNDYFARLHTQLNFVLQSTHFKIPYQYTKIQNRQQTSYSRVKEITFNTNVQIDRSGYNSLQGSKANIHLLNSFYYCISYSLMGKFHNISLHIRTCDPIKQH